MDYEQKYKDALEKLQEALAPTEDGCKISGLTRGCIENIFPELKELEDERIRKEFCKDIRTFIPNEKANKYIAWLEKQGKETSWKPSKEEMDVLYGLAYITNQYDEHKEEVITRLYQDLKREFFNGSSYENMFPNTSTEDDVRRRSILQVLEYARSLESYNQYGKADIDKNIAWLEEQGHMLDPDKVIEWLKHCNVTDCDVRTSIIPDSSPTSNPHRVRWFSEDFIDKFKKDFGL